MESVSSSNRGALVLHPVSTSAPQSLDVDVPRVLRNTYALLSLTLLFSAGTAAASVAWALPAPGVILTLAGYFGLLFAVYKLRNRSAGLAAVFALTGFMGYTLGPLLAKTLSLPGGSQVAAQSLDQAGSGATPVALLPPELPVWLSAWIEPGTWATAVQAIQDTLQALQSVLPAAGTVTGWLETLVWALWGLGVLVLSMVAAGLHWWLARRGPAAGAPA